MTRRRFCMLAAAAGMVVMPTAALAQIFLPTNTDVFSNLVLIEASRHSIWRDINRGSAGIFAGVAASWGDPGAGSTNYILSADAQSALADRTAASDQIRGGGALLRRLSDEGALILARADVYALPSLDSRKVTAEIGGQLRFRMPFWLPERRPLIDIQVDRDIWQRDATYAHVGLRLDYKFGITKAALFDIGHAWSDYASNNFRTHGTDLTATLQLFQDPAKHHGDRNQTIEFFGRAIWTSLNVDPNLFDFGARLTSIH